jgi:hypothetical protein
MKSGQPVALVHRCTGQNTERSPIVSDPEASQGRWRHDMKNQLGVILGFSALLLEEMAPDDRRRSDVQDIHSAATRAMELLASVKLSEDPAP